MGGGGVGWRRGTNYSPLFFTCQDYIFSILTCYCDPPAGIELEEGMAYNPYFPGGAIGMPQQLFPDCVEYDDGERISPLPCPLPSL